MSMVIGVDVGTQGTKALLVDIEKGIIDSSYTGYAPETPRALWAQQHPDVWMEAVYKVIEEITSRNPQIAKDVKGVCISCLYGGSGIPVDQDINPVGPCLIWMDRRAEAQVDWVKNNIDLDELFNVTGNYVDSYYGYTKIMWYRDNEPEVWGKTKYFLPPNTYFGYRLTGELAVDHSSAGNIGGVYDLKKMEWSEPMMEKLGIPASMMPERLVASTDVIGGLTADAAAKVGLNEGTPLVAGGIDAAVATLSAGIFNPGNHVAMVGTSMCWGFITEEEPLDKGLISFPYVINPDKFTYTFGGAITAGAVVSWFVKEFAGDEARAEEICNINKLDLLTMKAKKIPAGSDNLLTLPYFMGERSPIWDPQAKGTIMGLNLTHTKAHVYRSMLEGVAYALRDNMEVVLGRIPLDDKVKLVGGASKSDLWCQIFADVTNHKIETIKEEVEAPLGDALLAALGVGLVDDPAYLERWFTLEDKAAPEAENVEVYNKLFAEYRNVYQQTKDVMARLS